MQRVARGSSATADTCFKTYFYTSEKIRSAVKVTYGYVKPRRQALSELLLIRDISNS